MLFNPEDGGNMFLQNVGLLSTVSSVFVSHKIELFISMDVTQTQLAFCHTQAWLSAIQICISYTYVLHCKVSHPKRL
jgi:hypothetical protein